MTASKGWVKLPAASETTARAFVLVENPTMYDVYVVSAASDVAAEVQFHELKPAADGKTTIVKEITAPAYSSVELKPDGVHLVLTGLKRALKEGETITLMLTTDGGATVSVPAVVKP